MKEAKKEKWLNYVPIATHIFTNTAKSTQAIPMMSTKHVAFGTFGLQQYQLMLVLR